MAYSYKLEFHLKNWKSRGSLKFGVSFFKGKQNSLDRKFRNAKLSDFFGPSL